MLFAATAAEGAWHPPLGAVLAEWFRDRLAPLSGWHGDGETIGALEARVRRAAVLCHRYRQARYQLFGDNTWLGGEQGVWWCPDVDLAARAPYWESKVPARVVRLREGTARTGAGHVIVDRRGSAPSPVRFTVDDGVARLDGNPDGADVEEVLAVVREGLRALRTDHR